MLTTAAVFLEKTSLLVDVLVEAVLAETTPSFDAGTSDLVHGLL